MKAVRKMWGLVAVGLLVAGAAWGQSNTVNTGDHYENKRTGFTTDNNGYPYFQDVSRDRDNWTLIGSFSDTLNSATGVGVRQFAQLTWSAESTTVAASYQYRRMWLALRVIPAAGDTSFKTYLAVQVRAHTAALADSDNTFAWYAWAPNTSGIAASDSLGQIFSGATAAQGSGNPATAHPSEKLFIFQPGFGYGGMIGPRALFSWPNAIWQPLVDQRGVWFGAPYTSVRVRMLWGTGPVKVICKLYGAS